VRAQIEPYAEGWHCANVDALGQSEPLWLVLGDSTAQGIGASAYDRGWVGQLRDRMAAAGQAWRVVNLSQSGGRVRDVLDDQLPLADRLGLVPALITVAVGANDLRPSRRDGLEPALEQLTAVLPAGTVIGTIPGRPKTVAPINELIRQWAARHNLRVAETGSAIAPPWRGKLASDWFHPNDVGYAMWARAFADALEADGSGGG
jgi:lysophospholipase L1-like esterase